MIKRLKILFLFLPIGLSGQQLGFALEQLNAREIIDQKLTGKGIKVGIIDGGFLKADKNPSLGHLFERGLVAEYRDYLDSLSAPYSGSKALDDTHGTEVWEMVAGYHQEKDIQYGLATGATYYLARTDHGAYERREEERNAIRAMEWMAEEGVKIINLSLGYNYGYTDKSENYQPHQMDGKSTILTRAVDRISKQYGILVIVAAGNDGEKRWRIIDSPADAASALTVGATKFKTWDDMTYSSKGPRWLPYVKPEVACFASSGTSFSTPVITGLAACILEKNPSLSGEELKQIILNSSSLEHPNNHTGYGVPDAALALKMTETPAYVRVRKEVIHQKTAHKLTINSKVPYVVVYHKEGWKVLEKETLRSKSKEYKIKKIKGAKSTTVLWLDNHLEIFWN